MSLSSYNQPNQLTDDVLLVIFDQLDDEDLLRCEAVCRQWRNFLISGRPWRRLFCRKMISSPQWRNILRIFGIDVEKLQTVHYRSLCRAIIQEQNQIDRNWRTGNVKKSSRAHLQSSVVTIGDNHIAGYYYDYQHRAMMLEFVHRTNLEVKSSIEIPRGSSVVTNAEIAVVWDKKNIDILDINGQLISKVPELDENELISWNLVSCFLSRDQMAVLSQTDGQQKLSLWDVSDPLRITRLMSERFYLDLHFMHFPSMRMDGNFIAIFTFQNTTSKFFFFFKRTLQLHWRKTVDGYNFFYGHGMLIIKQNYKTEGYGIIQVYDVTSGQLLREMRIANPLNSLLSIGFNAKFMVVAESPIGLYRSYYHSRSELKIYDLEAVKNPQSTENDLLVSTVSVKFEIFRIWMDETLLICANPNNTFVLDFGSFELFGNEAKSVTLSLPWRSVWRATLLQNPAENRQK
jgi:F-box-like